MTNNNSNYILSPSRVEYVFRDCLYSSEELKEKRGEVPPEAKVIRGVNIKVAFNPKSLSKNRTEILAMLENLTPKFTEGLSFMCMGITKNNTEWTSLHRSMQELLCLGLAVGKLEYCCKEDMWEFLPGGVPYIRLL